MVSTVTAHSNRISAVLKDRAATARSAVAASWSRSLFQHGLDPGGPRSPHQVSYEEFRLAYEQVAPMVNAAFGVRYSATCHTVSTPLVTASASTIRFTSRDCRVTNTLRSSVSSA